MNYSPTNLKKIEALIRESGYVLRYEKGNFNSGYCILLDMNVIIVNKYFTDDVKFQKLIDLVFELKIDVRKLNTETSLKFWDKLLALKQLKPEEIPFDGIQE